MLVRDIMTKNVIAIGSDMPIKDVHALMTQRNIRHFPILEDEGAKGGPRNLMGIVSDRDIRSVGSELPNAKRGVTLKDPVRQIMTRSVITAHPLDPIEESAKVLRERKIGAMPVLDDGELVGIVTAIDFLQALVRMTGVLDAASRLEVEVANRPGALAALANAISLRGVNISSVLTTHRDDSTMTFVLRVDTINVRNLARELRDEEFIVTWPPEKAQT
jgi:acetoin utilization protein AcuB